MVTSPRFISPSSPTGAVQLLNVPLTLLTYYTRTGVTHKRLDTTTVDTGCAGCRWVCCVPEKHTHAHRLPLLNVKIVDWIRPPAPAGGRTQTPYSYSCDTPLLTTGGLEPRYLISPKLTLLLGRSSNTSCKISVLGAWSQILVAYTSTRYTPIMYPHTDTSGTWYEVPGIYKSRIYRFSMIFGTTNEVPGTWHLVAVFGIRIVGMIQHKMIDTDTQVRYVLI